MPGNKLLHVLLLAGWVASGTCSAVSVEAGSAEVLVLHSADLSIPASTLFDPAMREALERNSRRPVLIRTEQLAALPDLVVADDTETADRLARKYAQRPPELVMPVGSIALDFAVRHRARLWPGVPIIFYAVGTDRLRRDLLQPGISGVTHSTDVGRTISLARRLQPQAPELVLVVGSSAYDRRWRALARSALEPPPAGLRIAWLEGMPLLQLQQRLRQLEPTAIVIYLSMLRDDAGQDYIARDALRRVAEASPAPVYGVLESMLGHGIVGGSFQDFRTVGAQAGLLAARVLNGERAPQISEVFHTEPVCEVDGRELRRHGLPGARLPPDCRTQFLPAPFWEAHGTAPVAAGAVVIVALLCAAAYSQSRRRARAEARAQRRERDLAHAGRLVAAGELSASLSHELAQPLAAILSNAAAGQLMLQEPVPDLQELREVLMDIRDADLHAHSVIQRLTDFLKKRELRLESIDLSAVARDMEKLVGHEAQRRGVLLHCELQPGLPPVLGDRVQLQQVALNLLMNALDAAADAPAATVAVRTRTCPEGVLLEVADSGAGIPAENLPRLFDSFFTTKEHGMGLGLALARMIVEAHQGRISAENGPASGAVFRVVLPAIATRQQGSGASRPARP